MQHIVSRTYLLYGNPQTCYILLYLRIEHSPVSTLVLEINSYCSLYVGYDIR